MKFVKIKLINNKKKILEVLDSSVKIVTYINSFTAFGMNLK